MSTLIYLGDLVHNWEKASVWTFPLNIGFVATYAQKLFGKDVEIRLFKDPQKMLDEMREEKPQMIGLAYYVWNLNLNNHIMKTAKELDPEIITIGGGPTFTSANNNEESARSFFQNKQQYCDFYVVNQGEMGFATLLTQYFSLGRDGKKLKENVIPGIITNKLSENGTVFIGPKLDPVTELDEIPSPYLSGLLDEFFEGPYDPIIETNRSCPYRCTFCAWGIGTSKLYKFSDERVIDEIKYIAQKCKKATTLFIGDANFAILERDSLFAKTMYECHMEYGFPGYVAVQWNKSRPDRVLAVAKELKGIANVSQSFQSLNEATLKAIKRINLPMDKVAAIAREIEGEGVNLRTELILGLPEETFESHLEANRILIDRGISAINYNLHFLPGTEMDKAEYRNQYGYTTGYRLHDNAYGIYDGVKVLEAQEIALGHAKMSEKELGSFRFIHFLIQFMWANRWYHDFLIYHKNLGIHPVDFILAIYQDIQQSPLRVREIYDRFETDHCLENFDSEEALIEYWSKPDNFERLRSGDYGKLNGMYSFVILFEYQKEFNEFLFNLSRNLAARKSLGDMEEHTRRVKDILKFNSELCLKFNDEFQPIGANEVDFDYDILALRQNNCQLGSDGSQVEPVRYRFFLSETQQDFLQKQLHKYSSHNLNMTLRKMSEYVSAKQLLYQVERVPHKSAIGVAINCAAIR